MEDLREILESAVGNEQTGRKIEKVIFNIIFSYIKDMVFIMKVEEGPCFRYLFANQVGAKHAGINMESIGRTIEETLPYDRAFPLQQAYEKVVETKDIHIFFDETILPDGTKIYGESVLTPVKDESGAISYVVSVTRDITETVIEKERLGITEQRYRSIVDHNLDGVFIIKLDGKIMEVNPAGQKLTGYTEKQMRNRSIFDMIAEADVNQFQDLFNNTIAGFALESLDCRFIHSKGHHLTLHIKTAPLVIHSEIQGVFVIIRDISAQAESAETIKYMAFHDQLTGLLNRRALLDDLETQIMNSKNTGQEFALLSIDLDRFKHINDTLGHLAGDEILIKVSERLSEVKRDNCKVYRQGGDEFNILLLETNRQEVSRFAQNILSSFTSSFYLKSEEYYITPSIGISIHPNDGKDAETLIKNADEALFRVKEKGKAHYQFYRSDMNSLLTNVVSLETHLRKAIERDELSLHYQPQVDLKTNKVASFEALLRWNSAELGMISPADFIPLAEDTGLIIPIGNWVIDTACKQIKNWTEMKGRPLKIAINISPKQFQQPNLVDIIKNAIRHYNIDPACLEIEITEGTMQDTEETAPILRALKELGVCISIDDFGTGYSSLNYIKQFPIDVLKIDQSFVREVHNNEKDAAITTTIIHLAKSLGMEVVAEGVENQLQVNFLLEADCQKVQGFFYSKPLRAEEIEKKFLKWE